MLNFKTTAPKNWGDGQQVVHRNLKVDCDGMPRVEGEKLMGDQWTIRFQQKERQMKIEEARGYTNKTVKWDLINAKMVKVEVREMTTEEIIAKAKSDPAYKAELLAGLA